MFILCLLVPVGPGGFPPQLPYSFPPGFPIPPQDGPKKGAFPPEKTDPALVEKSNELMTHFNDKAWPYMWFLNRGGRGSHGLDMNVDEAWAEGLSGKGISIMTSLNFLIRSKSKFYSMFSCTCKCTWLKLLMFFRQGYCREHPG